MPLCRYEIANEYSHAAPELYCQSGDGNIGMDSSDESIATLQGVSMAGLVGIVRQLGDLAKFAGEVFSDLHEEVMATSTRGHDLLLRVRHIEEVIPEIEKSLLSEPNQLGFAYIPGMECHVSIGINQNLFNQGDLPRFVRNSYRDCRGPPRLFFLDKFDAGGAGSCMKRYTDPSFFKIQWANSEISKAEKEHLERKGKREKKKRNQRWSRKTQQATALSKINTRIGSNSPELKNIMVSSNVWNQNANSEERSKDNLIVDTECRTQDSLTEVQKGFDDNDDNKNPQQSSEPITDPKSQLFKPISNQNQETEKPSDKNSEVQYMQTSSYSCNQEETQDSVSYVLQNKVSQLGFSQRFETRETEINKGVSQKVDSITDPDEIVDSADFISKSSSELETMDISASKDKKLSSGLGEVDSITDPDEIVDSAGFINKSSSELETVNISASKDKKLSSGLGEVDSITDPDEIVDSADFINKSSSKLETVDISASKDNKLSSGQGEKTHATMPPSIVENVSNPTCLLWNATTTENKASFLVKDAGKEKKASTSLDESSDSEVEDIHFNRPIERKRAQSSIVATHKSDEKTMSRRSKSHHHSTIGEASSVYEIKKFHGKVSIPSSTSDDHLIKHAKIPMDSTPSNAPLVKQELPPESLSPLLQTKEHPKERSELLQDEKTSQFHLQVKSKPIYGRLSQLPESFVPVCEVDANTNNANRNVDVNEDEKEILNAINTNTHSSASSSPIASETGADIISESPHPNHGISLHSSSGLIVESTVSLPSRKSSESLTGSVTQDSDHKEKNRESHTLTPTPVLNDPLPLSESLSLKDRQNKDSEGFLTKLPFPPSRKAFQEAYHKKIDPSRQERKADRKPIKTYMPSFIPTRPSIYDFSDDSEPSVKQHDTPLDHPKSSTEHASVDSTIPSPSLKQFTTPRNITVDSTKAPSKINIADNIKPSPSISSDISSPSNSPSPHIISTMNSSGVPVPPALPDNTPEGYYQGHNPYVPAIGLMNRSESLIKAIASHDRSKLKKVSDISPPPKNPMDDARQQLLEQIRSQKFTLKQTVVKKRTTQLVAPSINVAAILEKANAIRQALEGFDEGSDSWSDS